MKVIKAFKGEYFDEEAIGVGLGNFDGLHIGHMELLRTLITESHKMGIKSMIYTFFNHPGNVVKEFKNIPLITPYEDKVYLLNKTKLNYLFLEKFDHDLSCMEPEEFFRKKIVEQFKAKLVVVGFNYRFGHGGIGDTYLLQKLGKENGVKVIIIPPVEIDGEIVSSTIIREYIKNGNLRKVTKMLGRYHFISGYVQEGNHIGTSLGIPTANLQPKINRAVPQNGTYVTRTIIKNKVYNSVTNIGYNPTVRGKKRTIETHILDFCEDLYGEMIRVQFIHKIREEKRFDSIESLKLRIMQDIDFTKGYLEKFDLKIANYSRSYNNVLMHDLRIR